MFDGEWVRSGNIWYYHIDGQPRRCISCGRPIEYVRPANGAAHHHCRPRHVAAKEAANTRGREPLMRKTSYNARLADGFAMLAGYTNALAQELESYE